MAADSGKVVLLLGAGASRDAGCPTVVELTQSFRKSLSSVDRSAFEWIMERLEESGHPQPDIELVLSSLRELQTRQSNVLAAFVTGRGWRAEVAQYDKAFPRLEKLLERHIQTQCQIRSRELIDYLRPIKDLIPPDGTLDIFSLNYDYAIELVCQEMNVPYTDGFTTYWSPDQFEHLSYGVRLHKLHGSLLWYETARAPKRIVKIPALSNGNGDLRFFSDDDVSSVVLYPALVKEQHTEPYATLVSRFREALRDAQFLVCIGYSFRDQYIKDLVLEKVHENLGLRLVVVDPRPHEVVRKSDVIVSGTSWTFRDIPDLCYTIQAGAAEALAGGGIARTLTNLSHVERAIIMCDRARSTPQGASSRIPIAQEVLGLLNKERQYRRIAELVRSDADACWTQAATEMGATRDNVGLFATVMLVGERRNEAKMSLLSILMQFSINVVSSRDGRRVVQYYAADEMKEERLNLEDLGSLFGIRAQYARSFVVQLSDVIESLRGTLPVQTLAEAESILRDAQTLERYWDSALDSNQIGAVLNPATRRDVQLAFPSDPRVLPPATWLV